MDYSERCFFCEKIKGLTNDSKRICISCDKTNLPVYRYYNSILYCFDLLKRKVKIQVDKKLEIRPNIFLPDGLIKYYEQGKNFNYTLAENDFTGSSLVFKNFIGVYGRDKNAGKIDMELSEKFENRISFGSMIGPEKLIFLYKLYTNFINDTYSINKFGLTLPRRFNFCIKTLDSICLNSRGVINYNDVNRVKLALKSIFNFHAYFDEIGLRAEISKHDYNIDIDVIKEGLKYIESEQLYTLQSLYDCETNIANNIVKLTEKTPNLKISLKNKKDLDSTQSNIAEICLNKYLSIIIGGPGTGKTQIISSMVRSCENVIVCSFMGSAVENIRTRLSREISNQNKLAKEIDNKYLDNICMTLHSFKQRYYNSIGNKNSKTYVSQYLKSDCKVFIIDEFSMVDIKIFSKILDIITKENIRLILVGDQNQLPSIGPGNLLSELINFDKKYGKFPVYELVKCYRSDNTITVLNKIVNNNMLDLSTDHVRYIYANETMNYLDGYNLYDYFKKDGNIIICPKNVSVKYYNEEIQKCNPNEYLCRGLKKGDKLLCNINFSAHNLYNGSVLELTNIKISKIGKIFEVRNDEYNETKLKNTDEITIFFKGRKPIELKVSDFEEYFSLGYARTVHKSQGKEYNNVFLLFDKYDSIAWDRRLLYTAVSRTKENCYISGNIKHLQLSCERIILKHSLIEKFLKKHLSVDELIKENINENDRSDEIVKYNIDYTLNNMIKVLPSNLPNNFVHYVNKSNMKCLIKEYEKEYEELINYAKLHSNDTIFNWLYDQQLSIKNKWNDNTEILNKSLTTIFIQVSKNKIRIKGDIIETWNNNAKVWHNTAYFPLMSEMLKSFFKKLKRYITLEQTLYSQNKSNLNKIIDLNYTERINNCDKLIKMMVNYYEYISKFSKIDQETRNLFICKDI